MPLISIITVTRNAAPLVRDCTRSVYAQRGFSSFAEHLLVDAVSTDQTRELVAAASGGATRILCEPDRGLYDGMNKGVRLAAGEIVGFLNADDLYAHDRVLETVRDTFASNPGLLLCHSGLCYVDRMDTQRVVRRWPARQLTPFQVSLGLVPAHPTVFMRRDFFLSLGGFDLTYKIAADSDLLFRALHGRRDGHLSVDDCWVHMREGGVSNKSWSNVNQASRELRRSMRALGLRFVPLRLCLRYATKLAQYLPRRMSGK